MLWVAFAQLARKHTMDPANRQFEQDAKKKEPKVRLKQKRWVTAAARCIEANVLGITMWRHDCVLCCWHGKPKGWSSRKTCCLAKLLLGVCSSGTSAKISKSIGEGTSQHAKSHCIVWYKKVLWRHNSNTTGPTCTKQSTKKKKSPRREVVRSSEGVCVVYPAFGGSLASHTPRHHIGCPTPCKIIILPNTMIPQWIF